MTEENIIKISELDPVDDLYDGCCMPLVQMGETKKIEYATLKSKLNEDLDFVKNTDDLEERMTTLENNEEDQNEHIRDLINGYAGKVDKVTGKGLSTNDYTTEDKTLLNDIYNALPTNEVSNEQIHITDAAALPLKKINVKGNTRQETTTPTKNIVLSDKQYWESGHYDTTGNKQANASRIRQKELNAVQPSTTYYTGIPVILRTYNQSKTFVRSVGYLGGLETFTTNSNEYYISISMDGTMENFTGDTQFICLNSESDKTFVKGYPTSPSPDYPQEVEVVSGDNSIDVCGKNLFDKNNTELNKRVKEDGTLENSTGYYTSDFIKVTPNTSYSMTRAGTHRGKFYDSNKNALTNTYDFNASSGNITFNTTPNCQYVRFTIDSNFLDTLQLKKDTQASNYEPYQSQTYPISLGNIELCKIGDYQDKIAKSTGKNLFDKDNVVLGKRLDLNGKVITDEDYFVSDFIKVNEAEIYTKNSPSEDAYHRICFYTSDNQETYISRSETNTNTIPSNCKYIRLTGQQSELDTTQIEKGNQATSYEPYGKVWYIEKQIGKVVLDGSENWVVTTTKEKTQVFYTSILNLKHGNLISNNFIYNNPGDSEKVTAATAVDVNLYIAILKSRITGLTPQAFKTWLSTHNTIVYYVLETPEITEITDSVLVGQLEELSKLKPFKGTNNIEMLANISGELDIEYVQDIKALINNLNNALLSLGANI